MVVIRYEKDLLRSGFPKREPLRTEWRSRGHCGLGAGGQTLADPYASVHETVLTHSPGVPSNVSLEVPSMCHESRAHLSTHTRS